MTAPDRPEPGPDAGVEDIEADIEATRQQLGETVEALSAKLDVKQQAKDKVDETKQRVAVKAQTAQHVVTDNPQKTVPVVAVAVALLVALIVWRRRR
ncbi:DUF3618 domain-containing protein [Mycolicibacterium litorale]|uniref:DUF3618 domain-containing protein n=1 Tax=Mycolicibacterium litorale TaxID=758802 RepID=A0AAD1MUQ2_9MYCO|nr:DUF3618 domain-containing protein [Mycolicibacterium litorale]MCV7415246.1 DUF3618 domain-containing protein [Mycolicibacterium litorale]TDY08501.1 uncharacterized protein DUF3618 [Mycolicibacterium litorale]BBY16426.1 hypothetical protein MLIT_20180 [Mycolicibacterium litorale]